MTADKAGTDRGRLQTRKRLTRAVQGMCRQKHWRTVRCIVASAAHQFVHKRLFMYTVSVGSSCDSIGKCATVGLWPEHRAEGRMCSCLRARSRERGCRWGLCGRFPIPHGVIQGLCCSFTEVELVTKLSAVIRPICIGAFLPLLLLCLVNL